MDFAYLNAVIKSTSFPPYDPWLAGGYINYYYFGQVLVATLIKLTGTVPSVAYNLAVALFFAPAGSGAFSFVSNFLLGNDDHLPPGTASRLGRPSAGLLAALFVAVIGNLDGLAQMSRAGKAATWRSAARSPAWPAWCARHGRRRGALGTPAAGRFDFWRSTRVIGPEDPGPITEFPYFTFLYGDLHAHMLALPVTLLALHVALALARSGGLAPLGRALSHRAGGSARGAAAAREPRIEARLAAALGQDVLWLIALGGLTVGLLRATNTWDFPTYLLLMIGAGAVAEFHAVRVGSRPQARRSASGDCWRALYRRLARSRCGRTWRTTACSTPASSLLKLSTSLVHYVTVLGLLPVCGGEPAGLRMLGAAPRASAVPGDDAAAGAGRAAQGFWSPLAQRSPGGSPGLTFATPRFAGVLVAIVSASWASRPGLVGCSCCSWSAWCPGTASGPTACCCSA